MMKLAVPIFLFLLIITASCQTSRTSDSQNSDMTDQKLHYLALGDSYTIGEGVQEEERYPMILVQLLENENILFNEPKIIATTGWTTDELKKGIAEISDLRETYDLVTLLIGVNNQYRGRSIENYRIEFEALLDQAIAFAGGNPKHVQVLSIPDWGITPFAKEKGADQVKVAREIDQFNEVKENISNAKGVAYTDITSHYRIHGDKEDGVVADNLHPSRKIYQHWAEQLKSRIMNNKLYMF